MIDKYFPYNKENSFASNDLSEVTEQASRKVRIAVGDFSSMYSFLNCLVSVTNHQMNHTVIRLELFSYVCS